MTTKVFKVKDNGDQEEAAVYVNNLSTKANLISFVEQLKGNYQTWGYPFDLPGIVKGNHGSYAIRINNCVYIARSK